jgi:hypothetical protein
LRTIRTVCASRALRALSALSALGALGTLRTCCGQRRPVGRIRRRITTVVAGRVDVARTVVRHDAARAVRARVAPRA